MTPAAPLVAFCAVMAAIAVGRLARDEDRDPVDVGTALVVVGITVWAVLWASISESWLNTPGRVAVAILGGAVTAVGVTVIARNWSEYDDPARGFDGENS